MEFVVGILVAAAVLVAVLLLIASRRSRSRSTLDPSRDVYQGFPEHRSASPYTLRGNDDTSSSAGGGNG